MIDAEYEELNDDGSELDLADTDSLPWLESDEDDNDAGGLDPGQIVLFIAAMVLVLGAVVGGVWFVTNRAADEDMVADGSVIPAPEGPVKQRPDDPGGKEFAGTGNVAPVVGEGGSRPAVVAEAPVPATSAAPKPSIATLPAASPSEGAAPAVQGVGVQLAAYGTRARAEQGWTDITRRTDVLSGVKYRIVEGKVDIGTVYRLQAVAPNRTEAERMCASLKAGGIDCQVK
ncbi:SPOR domain-containing protein [Erythrobacter sp. R86502]|uniref:SPOR domain-containing protein n=1 Tax=Erythrobacter sp. R86502 TaxID=3093846 RepID=UPI0036D3FF2E